MPIRHVFRSPPGTALLAQDAVLADAAGTAVVLGDSVAVLTPRPQGRARNRPVLSAAVVGFGTGPDEIGWIDIAGEHADGFDAEEFRADQAQLLPVPGAVVAHVPHTRPALVHGLVG